MEHDLAARADKAHRKTPLPPISGKSFPWPEPVAYFVRSGNPRRSNGNNLFHYCLNEHVNGLGSGNQVKLSAIPHTARVVWLFDNGKLAAVAQQNNVHTNLHSHGAQFSFLDGHSARFKNTEYWNFAENQGRTNNPSLVWMP